MQEICELAQSKVVPLTSGLVLLFVLAYVGRRAHPEDAPSREYYVSLLIAGCGVGFGMVAASFASPTESAEGATFKLIAGILATFASGFLLKKYESQINDFPQWMKASALNQLRFWMFLAAFLGAALTTYVYRAYYPGQGDLSKVRKELEVGIAKLQATVDKLQHLPAKRSTEGPR